MRTIIGLTGYARAGKDSAADILVRDYGFTKKSFAGPLKNMLRTLDPIITCDWEHNPEFFECGEINCCESEGEEVLTVPLRLSDMGAYTEDELKRSFPEYRRLLQVLATDCVRAMDPEFWVNAARREVLAAGPDARIVFTDCRFPNEADMIRELDFHHDTISVVAQVSNPNVTLAEGSHVSEQHVGQLGEEWVLSNGGESLDQLASQVGKLAAFVGVNRAS